ncbi:MAG: 3-oxoacyl-[acyl-carrier protein] reductase [Gammaproteobacteria bacterium]|jgi:3-oxoacyl-[acyl-carrier protein] reductase
MQPVYDLKNRKVLITGAASGIGLATVKQFLDNKATVALNDLPGEKLDRLVADLTAAGHSVFAAPGNIGNPTDAETMVNKAISDMDGLDFLINNAGTPATSTPIEPSDFERQDEVFWNTLLNVNLLGPYRCTKAAAQALKRSKGAIVNTASVSAFGGGGSSSPYCATKAALVSLTREWSRALAPDVRVNAIAPGLVDSDWMCRFEETGFDVSAEIPLGRQGSPDEYAEVIIFLAASASYLTGQTLIVDGGMMT